MITLNDYTNLCLSGGADGADVQWGMCAGLKGHKVIHWSFPDHRTQAPDDEVVRLNDELLAEADESIKLAGKVLKKHPPKQPFVKRLIQRNYYQVAWSDSVYAVTDIKDGIAQGGTAWAIYIYLCRTDLTEKKCYVFDQTKDAWFKFVGGDEVWSQIDTPPQPQGIWAGIGTRNLKDNGKAAIRKLLDYVRPSTL